MNIGANYCLFKSNSNRTILVGIQGDQHVVALLFEAFLQIDVDFNGRDFIVLVGIQPQHVFFIDTCLLQRPA